MLTGPVLPAETLPTVLTSSVYEHIGIAWVFDQPFTRDLAVKNAKAPLYLSTHMNGESPYFTSSLESTIPGSAAAYAFDSGVTRLPT